MRSSTQNNVEVWLESRSHEPVVQAIEEPTSVVGLVQLTKLADEEKGAEWARVSERSARVVEGGGKFSLFGGLEEVSPNSEYRLAVRQGQSDEWGDDLKVEVHGLNGSIAVLHLLAGQYDTRYLDLKGWTPYVHIPRTEMVKVSTVPPLEAGEPEGPQEETAKLLLEACDGQVSDLSGEVLRDSVTLPAVEIPVQAEGQSPAGIIPAPEIAVTASTAAEPGLGSSIGTEKEGCSDGLLATNAEDTGLSNEQMEELARLAEQFGQADEIEAALDVQHTTVKGSDAEHAGQPLAQIFVSVPDHVICSLQCTLDHGPPEKVPLLIQETNEEREQNTCALRISVSRGYHNIIPVYPVHRSEPYAAPGVSDGVTDAPIPKNSQDTLVYGGVPDLDFGSQTMKTARPGVIDWTPAEGEDSPWCSFQYSCGEDPNSAPVPMILQEDDRIELLAALNVYEINLRLAVEEEMKRAKRAERKQLRMDREIFQRETDRLLAERAAVEAEKAELKEKRRQAGLKGHQTKLDRGIVQPAAAKPKKSQAQGRTSRSARDRDNSPRQRTTATLPFKSDRHGRWPRSLVESSTTRGNGKIPYPQFANKVGSVKPPQPRQRFNGHTRAEHEAKSFPDEACLVPESDDENERKSWGQDVKFEESKRVHARQERSRPRPYVGHRDQKPYMRPRHGQHRSIAEDHAAPNHENQGRSSKSDPYPLNYTIPKMSSGAAPVYRQRPPVNGMRRRDAPGDYGIHIPERTYRVKLETEEQDLRPVEEQKRAYEERERARQIVREREERRATRRVERTGDMNHGKGHVETKEKQQEPKGINKRKSDESGRRSPNFESEQKRQRQSLDPDSQYRATDLRTARPRADREAGGRFHEATHGRAKVRVVVDMTLMSDSD